MWQQIAYTLFVAIRNNDFTTTCHNKISWSLGFQVFNQFCNIFIIPNCTFSTQNNFSLTTFNQNKTKTLNSYP